jgi:hypothetical protein
MTARGTGGRFGRALATAGPMVIAAAEVDDESTRPCYLCETVELCSTLNIMEIAFRTKALRTLCLNKEAMDDRYGAENAARLRVWLADLRAAQSIGDAPLLHFSPLLGSLGHEATMSIGVDLRAIVRANHQHLPKLTNGDVDWLRVERLLIQKIECINKNE